jgi:hypothetical protein
MDGGLAQPSAAGGYEKNGWKVKIGFADLRFVIHNS